MRELLAGKRVILIDDSHRARHDEPQDREDGSGGRRDRSAHADQLSADDVAVFLRNRYADEERTDRIQPHGRRNLQIHRSRFARVPQPARLDARCERQTVTSSARPAIPANTRSISTDMMPDAKAGDRQLDLWEASLKDIGHDEPIASPTKTPV